MDQIDEIGKFGVELLFAEEFLSDCRINIFFKDMEILRLRLSHFLDKFGQLRKIKKSDIVLILSHGLKDASNNFLLLLFWLTEAFQDI